jgi:cell wall-associated NlpC family hydrolase
MPIPQTETLTARPSPEDLPYGEMLITRPVVPMFAAPDSLSEQVSQGMMGMRVRVTGGRDPWRFIQTPDGYEGWVARAGLASIPDDWGAPFVEVIDLWANLRGRASSKLAAATQATIGARLPLLSRDEKWVELLLPDMRRVWTEAIRVAEVGDQPLRPRTPRAAVSTARRFLGVPYLWGGCSPMGLDCSGFVQLVLRLHGIELLRDAHQQATEGAPAPEPNTGDLVFFGPVDRPEKITHVGMMLDRARFIHAAGSDRVRINRLADEPYVRELRFARRYF